MANEFTRVTQKAQSASDQYEVQQYHYTAMDTTIVLAVSDTVRGIYLVTESAAGTSNNIIYFSKYDSPTIIYEGPGTNTYTASQSGNVYTINFVTPLSGSDIDFVTVILY